MKKKIGISYTATGFLNYWNWFSKEDLQDDLELVELSFEKNNTEDISKCDGFVLTGGVDVHPSFYNGNSDYDNSPGSHEPDRDHFEEKIYRYSQANNLPVLGICRGMQLVNVLEGGKLIQDLSISNTKHKKEEADKEHAVAASNNSLLYDITGSVSGHVNSAHHQAIDPDALGENLKANAYDGDDTRPNASPTESFRRGSSGREKVIEGFEFNDKTNKGFMLCVQWHPERIKDKEENPFSKKIKERFLTEIRKVKK